MINIADINRFGDELEQSLKLRTHPIAVKMLKSEDEIPEGALRPRRDNGNHLAQCQAFSLSRRQGTTVAMLRDDHWCFAALLAYGLEKKDENDEFIKMVANFPMFDYGKYVGVLTAPLQKAASEPDVVLVYAEPAQVRQMLVWIKMSQRTLVTTVFDPIDSCAYSIIPSMQTGEYRITFPDPGEQARAAAREDEVIFSIPAPKLPGFMEAFSRMKDMEKDSPWPHIVVTPDFPRPDFYAKQFKKWGLETGPKE